VEPSFQQQQIQQQVQLQQLELQRQQDEAATLRNQQWMTQPTFQYRGRGPGSVVARLIMFAIIVAVFAVVLYLIQQHGTTSVSVR